MPYARRDFAGASTQTTIVGDVLPNGTTFTLADPTGWPDGTNGKFLCIVDIETATEEKFWATSRNGAQILVANATDRGADDTVAAAHTSGARIYHCHGAVDDDESNYAVAETVGRIGQANDMIVGSGPNAFRTVTPGADGTVLRVSGATVGWGTLGAGSLASDSVTADEIVAGAVGTDELAAGAVTRAKLEPLSQFPVGALIDYAGGTAPVGWLMCDGKEYLRTSYPLLDAVIGTTYGAYTNGAGAAGTTHFRVPDLRGRTAVAPDQMGGTDAGRLAGGALAGSGGAETLTIVGANLPGHAHGIGVRSGAESTSHVHYMSNANGAVGGIQASHGVVGGGGSHGHTVGGYFQPVIGVSIGSGNERYAQLGQASGSLVTFTTIDGVGNHDHGLQGHTSGGDRGHDHMVIGSTDNGAGTSTPLNKMPPYLLVNKLIYAAQ
jgi:microcystin-dependent protein